MLDGLKSIGWAERCGIATSCGPRITCCYSQPVFGMRHPASDDCLSLLCAKAGPAGWTGACVAPVTSSSLRQGSFMSITFALAAARSWPADLKLEQEQQPVHAPPMGWLVDSSISPNGFIWTLARLIQSLGQMALFQHSPDWVGRAGSWNYQARDRSSRYWL